MDLGRVLTGLTGTTTTLTDATANQVTVGSGALFPLGTPIIITAGGTPLQCTYVAGYVAATGVITVSPAITTGATDAVVITDPSFTGNKATRLTDAISRVFLNRLTRWQHTPLTFVPDGDLRGTTVTDYWTAAANGTAAYAAAQVFPAGSGADEAGAVGLSRVLQLTSTGATSVVGNGMRTILTANSRTWYFRTAIRLVSGTGTATFSVYDNTNSADITPTSVMHGNDTLTMTTTTLGDFMICEGTLQQPVTCAELAPKLTLSATGMVAQMTSVTMFPLSAVSFPLPNRITSADYVGNYYYGTALSQPAGIESLSFSEPITTGGRTHGYSNNGDHRTVTFNFRPTRPVWFDELAHDPDLSAMTSTSSFPLDYCFKWARFEILDYLFQKERQEFIPYGTRSVPVPSRWLSRRNAALRSAEGSEYAPELINVVGRVA